ncbi:hypothetical protein [Nocardiopsis sp. HUAS JQ3]|uniref:hypothetical protein n=1 Tax=Nocardiopsis sp. HUAS JQ3 TaxID=3061629 RepID=UPI0023A96FEE|nr:hypothetical protein [Nocardiopsis sp. HUAS JQ3]WDZ91192.1 hypothetical protein PV789_01025 [Nocardiopsis sp. HUAS JQ3]
MPNFTPRWTETCRGETPYGKVCGRPAIKGGYVCLRHGGKDPRVRNEALERYEEFLGEQVDVQVVRAQEWRENREELDAKNRGLSVQTCPVFTHSDLKLYASRRHARDARRYGEESRWCREGGAWHNVQIGRKGIPPFGRSM